MTPRGIAGRRTRCPVCGSRRIFPSLGRLKGSPSDTGLPRFSWRCRTCRTTMRATTAATSQMWRRRRPISSWMDRSTSKI